MTAQEDSEYITVEFPNKTAIFNHKLSFDKYPVAEDANVQEQVWEDLYNNQRQIEEEKASKHAKMLEIVYRIYCGNCYDDKK